MLLIEMPTTGLTPSASYPRFIKLFAIGVNKYLFLIFILWLLSGIKPASCQEQTTQTIKPEAIKINLLDNQLSIEAKHVTWQQLLTKLEEKTHISIQGAKPVASTVAVSIPALPVTEALQQLFNHRFDFVFQFAAQKITNSTIPKSVWLLRNTETVAQAYSLNNKHTEDKAKLKAKSQTAANDKQVIKHIEDSNTQDFIDKAQNKANPELRIQALANLSGHDQAGKTTTKHALKDALSDNNATVRQYAAQTLANLGGQDSSYDLRDTLNDPDIGVRIQVVENVALNAEGIALLQEARMNSDEIVQTMAEERLKQVIQ